MVADRAMIKHVPFNPAIGGAMGIPTQLSLICEKLEGNGWILLRVVPWGNFESIAIFTKGETE